MKRNSFEELNKRKIDFDKKIGGIQTYIAPVEGKRFDDFKSRARNGEHIFKAEDFYEDETLNIYVLPSRTTPIKIENVIKFDYTLEEYIKYKKIEFP